MLLDGAIAQKAHTTSHVSQNRDYTASHDFIVCLCE